MKVLITREIPQVGINLLKEHKEIELDYRRGAPLSKEDLKKAIRDVDAIIPVIPDQINKEVIEYAENLKIIAAYSVGYDHIDLDSATKKNIYVGNTPGDLTEAVAEHSFALMMSLGRRIAEADRFCRAKKYEYWDPMAFIGPKFMNKTLGIIGFGRIGQFFARMAKYGLNMKILYTDVASHPEGENLLDAEKVSLEYLLSNSDVVSIHVNLTEETKHMIDSDQFRLMKPLSILINTSRGPVIDENALVTALKDNVIAGAALDVFENEPRIHPDLLKLKNVVLTPHIASATWEARIQMARMAAENIIDVLIDKKPPRYLVNKELIKDVVSSIV
ncbi:MAG: D-glycerate dehydrogenase [Patescibacteria group bacterium]